MIAWVKPGTREEISIVTDFVDPALARFLRELVDENMLYASSDHALWDRVGYPASSVFEGKFISGN